MPLNKSKATRSAFAGYGFSRWKKLVTFWWFRINVWCLINPVWRKSILFLNLFDLSILYFDYLHVLLGLIVITTTRFEQFMNNHDLLKRPGRSWPYPYCTGPCTGPYIIRAGPGLQKFCWSDQGNHGTENNCWKPVGFLKLQNSFRNGKRRHCDVTKEFVFS